MRGFLSKEEGPEVTEMGDEPGQVNGEPVLARVWGAGESRRERKGELSPHRRESPSLPGPTSEILRFGAGTRRGPQRFMPSNRWRNHIRF